MAWGQLEPTPPHLTYLLFSTFLISYVLFVRFCRNRRAYSLLDAEIEELILKDSTS